MTSKITIFKIFHVVRIFLFPWPQTIKTPVQFQSNKKIKKYLTVFLIKMKFPVALSIISGSIGQNLITYPGKCPDIPNQPDFDVTRYTGIWYDYTSNDERNVPENANCVAAKYDILTENSISGTDSRTS